MVAKVIDGVAISKKVREEIKYRVNILLNRGVRPTLAVILVGDDPASNIYVRNKIMACKEVGLESIFEHYPSDMSQAELLDRIHALNSNKNVNGILVQFPLPKHINTHKIIESIDVSKDVDGFHVQNAGLLFTGQSAFLPCTPYGIIKILEEENISVLGKNIVVVGASNIVGKPMALLLLERGATVTLCHSQTRNLPEHTKHADILIVAVGQPGIIKGNMIKKDSVIIDVGINKTASGKVCGDVDFSSVFPIASAITPVPGGVGPMTITMLLLNTLEAAEKILSISC